MKRGPIEVVAADPAAEQAQLLLRTTISVLATTLTAAVALTIASLAQTPIGWGLTALAALAGLHPLAWYRWRQATTQRLEVHDLAPRWSRPVARAAESADRLRRLAERSPEGPVAEHFERLADTAGGYVVALHAAASQADVAVGDDDAELVTDMDRIVGQLAELVEAAERLRAAQRQHLETSPLVELTAETERLTDAIEQREISGS